MTSAESPGPSVAQVFDMLAGSYDQSGVEFFGPVGQKLVELIAPRPGERCLDIGCGRGAVTVPLATAVGPEGTVLGLDVSAGMLGEARGLVVAAGLGQVSLEIADAADLSALPGGYDVVTSSLVLFFLTDPASALRTWVDRLAPGGRIGLVTFGEEDEVSNALIDLLTPYAPPGLRAPTGAGEENPFASEAGMERLLVSAGAQDVTTTLVPTTVEFADVDAWYRFSLSTGTRAMWMRMPEQEKPRVLARAKDLLESTRTQPDEPCRLVWQMRYNLAKR